MNMCTVHTMHLYGCLNNEAIGLAFIGVYYIHTRYIGHIRLVRLQKDNFRLFLCKQTDKRQTSVCTTSKRIKENHWASYIYIYIYAAVSIYIYIYIQKKELMEAAMATSVCLLQMENGSLFSLVGKL
jgi:hypothetical protein